MSERARGPEIATSAFGLLAMTKKENNDMRTGRVRVPQVRDLETALRLYYERLERNYKRLQSLRLKPEGAVGGA